MENLPHLPLIKQTIVPRVFGKEALLELELDPINQTLDINNLSRKKENIFRISK